MSRTLNAEAETKGTTIKQIKSEKIVNGDDIRKLQPHLGLAGLTFTDTVLFSAYQSHPPHDSDVAVKASLVQSLCHYSNSPHPLAQGAHSPYQPPPSSTLS